LQLTADLLILDINDIKHDERGYLENFEFKRKKTQTTLGWHQIIERNNTHSEWQTGQANKYHTKS